MHNILKAATVLSTLAVGSFLLPSAANATLISIGAATSAGGSITTVATDGGSGFAQISGGFGTFTFNNASGTGSPILAQPTFQTTALDVSSSTAGTLYVYVTEQGLSVPTGINNFESSFTANTFFGAITSVQEMTLVSSSNALFGGTLMASTTFTSAPSTFVSTNATPTLSPFYSETTEYIVTATGSGSVNDTINIRAVPEPASVALFGMGLLGLGFVARKRMS